MCSTNRQQSPTQGTGPGDGLIPLEDLAALLFTGSDVLDFLQGYLTTDTADLDASPRFTALCNIKGRVVCTGYAWLDDSNVILVVHRSICAIVLGFLRPYLAFSRTKATEEPWHVFTCLGPEPPGRKPGSLSGGRIDNDRHLFVLPTSNQTTPIDTADAGQGRWRNTLIERREVWLEAATNGRFLPQMLGLVERDAVNFSKGCYLGQEVVARAQHRGEVKRALATLNWMGDIPKIGSTIEAQGREVGVVVAASPDVRESGQALAVLMRDRPGPFFAPQSNTTFRLPT